MTLVVTDASRYGIVMVGDSAITNSATHKVSHDAVKIHYAKQANIGFAIWGDAAMPDRRVDKWLSRYIRDDIGKDESIDDVSSKLVDAVNNELLKLGKPWDELRRGIHVAGYKDGCPVIYHLHTGPEFPGKQHELKVHKDYPDIHIQNAIDKVPGAKINLWDEYRSQLKHERPIHLRNGYYVYFGTLFDRIFEYSEALKSNPQIRLQFPYPSLQDRVEYFKVLSNFVADTLRVSHKIEGVDKDLHAIGFDQSGLQIDQRHYQ